MNRKSRSPSRRRVHRGLSLLCAGVFACSGGTGERGVVSNLPDVVFSGGGGTLTLRMETTQAAQLWATFEEHEGVGGERVLSVLEELRPGSYERTVEVPSGTYLFFEFAVTEATPGARLEWTVLLDGEVVLQEDDSLNEPLPSDLTFALQFEADDVASAREWTR